MWKEEQRSLPWKVNTIKAMKIWKSQIFSVRSEQLTAFQLETFDILLVNSFLWVSSTAPGREVNDVAGG